MSDQQAPAFRRGAEEAKEATKGGAPFARTVYFQLKGSPPGNTAIVRFVDDPEDWIVVDQYSYLPTKPKPKGWDANWPSRMSAISRGDVAFKGMFDSDFIAEHMRSPDGKAYKASPRTWTRLCVREEVTENGVRVGFKDKTREETRRKEDGSEEVVPVKDIEVVNLGYKNFFGFLEGFHRAYGTLKDRDYVITRSGDDKDTTYSIAPLDKIFLEDNRVFDLRDPEIAKRYETEWTLESVIMEMVSDEYIGRFFDPSYVDPLIVAKTAASGNGAPTSEQAKPDADSDAEARMRAIADRVKNEGVQSYDETPVEQNQPAQPAPAPTGSRNFD